MGTSEKYIEREAEKYGLARHPDKCNEKLKRKKGRVFCLNCFVNDLKDAVETNFRTLQLRYGLSNPEIEKTIQELLDRNQIKGFLDVKNQIFIFLWLLIILCLHDTFASLVAINLSGLLVDKIRDTNDRKRFALA